MPRRCVVGGCSNVHSAVYSLHRFPRDEETKRLWTLFVQNTRADFEAPTDHSVICSEHFSTESYERLSFNLKMQFGFCRRKRGELLPGAVPTLMGGQILALDESITASYKNLPNSKRKYRGRKKTLFLMPEKPTEKHASSGVQEKSIRKKKRRLDTIVRKLKDRSKDAPTPQAEVIKRSYSELVNAPFSAALANTSLQSLQQGAALAARSSNSTQETSNSDVSSRDKTPWKKTGVTVKQLLKEYNELESTKTGANGDVTRSPLKTDNDNLGETSLGNMTNLDQIGTDNSMLHQRLHLSACTHLSPQPSCQAQNAHMMPETPPFHVSSYSQDKWNEVCEGDAEMGGAQDSQNTTTPSFISNEVFCKSLIKEQTKNHKKSQNSRDIPLQTSDKNEIGINSHIPNSNSENTSLFILQGCDMITQASQNKWCYQKHDQFDQKMIPENVEVTSLKPNILPTGVQYPSSSSNAAVTLLLMPNINQLVNLNGVTGAATVDAARISSVYPSDSQNIVTYENQEGLSDINHE